MTTYLRREKTAFYHWLDERIGTTRDAEGRYLTMCGVRIASGGTVHLTDAISPNAPNDPCRDCQGRLDLLRRRENGLLPDSTDVAERYGPFLVLPSVDRQVWTVVARDKGDVFWSAHHDTCVEWARAHSQETAPGATEEAQVTT
ncbi:MAG TPA: hypothetical protein VNM48_01365 [Chloroflexota bacterium]|nr:hypothetical protein [Chloroflexota bacterium]